MTTCKHCNEDISDQISAAVAETEEKFDGYESPDDVAGLKKALETEREHKRKAERAAKAAKEATAGIDRSDFDKMVETQNENAATIKSQADQIAQLEANLKQFDGVDDRMKSQQAKLDKLTDKAVKGVATALISSQNGNVSLMLPHVEKHIREQLQNNLDLDGNDEKLQAWLMEARRNDPNLNSAFKATEQSGGGSQNDGGGTRSSLAAASKYPDKQSDFSDRQAIDFQREFGLDAYLDLPR